MCTAVRAPAAGVAAAWVLCARTWLGLPVWFGGCIGLQIMQPSCSTCGTTQALQVVAGCLLLVTSERGHKKHIC